MFLAVILENASWKSEVLYSPLGNQCLDFHYQTVHLFLSMLFHPGKTSSSLLHPLILAEVNKNKWKLKCCYLEDTEEKTSYYSQVVALNCKARLTMDLMSGKKTSTVMDCTHHSNIAVQMLWPPVISVLVQALSY